MTPVKMDDEEACQEGEAVKAMLTERSGNVKIEEKEQVFRNIICL